MADKKCTLCQRGPSYFEGCSHIDCPCRRLITAQPVGSNFSVPTRGTIEGISVNGGVRREPTTKDSE